MQRLKMAALGLGALLVFGSVPVSFCNSASAGFSLIVGLLSLAYGSLSLKDLKSFTVSASSVSAEFREQIDKAEDILSRLRAAEDRIFMVLAEQMLNKGGEHYLGGYGEEAKFNIVEQLDSAEVGERNPVFAANLKKLKRNLGLRLLFAVLGDLSDKNNGALTTYLTANPTELPTREEIVEIARKDGRQLADDALDAYEAFVFRMEYPSAEMRSKVYDLAHRRAPAD